MSAPIATMRGYRKPGGAIVTVERPGGSAHRYRVNLRRYAALRDWAGRADRGPTSGAWTRNGFAVSFWPQRAAKEVTED